ncbi:MAG: hypothetical protein ABEJ87_02340 [Candidatus Nanohalobium sp.]
MPEEENFTREDYAIMTGGLAVAVMGGMARQMGFISVKTTKLITLIVLLFAPVSIYSGKKLWGGEIAKDMELVAIGLGAVIIHRLPEILWGSKFSDSLGLSDPFWKGFFNFLGAVGFAIVSYGFYRFWKLANPDLTPDE